MTQEAIKLITPVGRLVWGSVSERQTEDYDGNKYPNGEGPFQFGLAVLKTDPGLMPMLQSIFQQAVGGYQNNPQIVQRINNEWQSGFTSGLFRFKIKDGDQPNAKGVKNSNTAGCFVFAFQTTLPIKCGNTMNAEIDAKSIKTGYFVDIAATCKVNDKIDGTAGVYLNPQVVRMVAFGAEITGGPSVEEAFANHAAPTNLPPGASLTPLAPSSEPGAGLPGGAAPFGGNLPAQTQQQPGGLPNVPGQPNSGGFSTTPSPSNLPINPQTGLPVQPHQAFSAGPGALPGMPGQR